MARKHIGKRQYRFGSYCPGCLDKQHEIDRLKIRVQSLESKLEARTQKENHPFFGSSTPSARLPVKENSLEENQKKKGGSRKGRTGHGRKQIPTDAEDQVIELSLKKSRCPACRGRLMPKDTVLRGVIDSYLSKARRLIYKCRRAQCLKCHKTYSAKPPVLPKNKYGNNLIASSLLMHYVHGIPLRRLEVIWGRDVIAGNLIKSFHRLAGLWKPAMETLKKDYRNSPVKHADETGWRTDGQSGYAWLFASENTSIYAFRKTRSSSVVQEILGTRKLPGVLGVDRYGGYNKAPCDIQYCYAHLLRDTEDLEKEFPDSNEVAGFVSCLAPLLANAMRLRAQPVSDRSFYRQARKLKQQIQKLARSPARHAGIQKIQDIFKDHSHRMYHWAKDRRVPADNNRAERELRPTVIARKVSFGSQSDNGAQTRSILMSVLHTARKRLKDTSLEEWLLWTLEEYTKNPDVNLARLLPKIAQADVNDRGV